MAVTEMYGRNIGLMGLLHYFSEKMCLYAFRLTMSLISFSIRSGGKGRGN